MSSSSRDRGAAVSQGRRGWGHMQRPGLGAWAASIRIAAGHDECRAPGAVPCRSEQVTEWWSQELRLSF
jgi:hypothetical protein